MNEIRFMTDQIRGTGGIIIRDKEGAPAPIALSESDAKSADILDFVFESLVNDSSTMGEVEEWLLGAHFWLRLLAATRSPKNVSADFE